MKITDRARTEHDLDEVLADTSVLIDLMFEKDRLGAMTRDDQVLAGMALVLEGTVKALEQVERDLRTLVDLRNSISPTSIERILDRIGETS